MSYNNNKDGDDTATIPTDHSDPSQSEVTALYEYINSYSFSSDAEFRSGLAVILGHPDTPASEAELTSEDDLVLKAKKKNITPPLDFAAYKNWLKSAAEKSRGSESQSPEDTRTTSNDFQPQHTTTTSSEGVMSSSPHSVPSNHQKTSEPAYPSSFAHIVELITTGQPIPGIQQIPDTVLTGHETLSRVTRRRKPWEKDDKEKELEEQK
ncbi:hypothetical protein T310_4606 [Rasamsonia emersonii CBS 393.64]|uniref:Uncharacterized protein n=1 Tax=Rasamsonia emersonii (strain ATCC 16479 / CBS 393.64 / IMI 116815) TaxID=1408163 RepID=A0A0F4YU28_RASE3|nr:hypothetical protein T310_4606 [Rasamsonia emersonii CBS 393.64]KKA21356.1 hypothetical protein T310_4606 [Rasamsonia emersonii CBS 393.64]